MRIKNCPKCNQEFECKTNRKYCSIKCRYLSSYIRNKDKIKVRSKEYAKQYYQKKKDNPEFKNRNKSKFNIWINKGDNRKVFNEKMRVYMKERSKRLYHERRDKGLCSVCGKIPSQRWICDVCLSKRKIMPVRAYKTELEASGDTQ